MKGWTKINSFARLHQAELRKDILEQNDIKVVIVNAKDSMFLLGEIELLVEDAKVEQAKFLLGEFEGWIKVDSYICRNQIERLEAKLKENEIETRIFCRETSTNLLPDYELYVKKENGEKATALLRQIPGWGKIAEFDKVTQTAHRVEKLEKTGIETIVVNKRDEEFNLLFVELYVEEKNAAKASKLIEEFDGWQFVDEFPSVEKAELNESLLERNFIDVLEFQKRDDEGKIITIELYVEEKNAKDAKHLIDENKKWVLLKSFRNMYGAVLHKELMEENKINAVIISDKDTAFLIGEINLFIEEKDLQKAQKLLVEYEKSLKELENNAKQGE